uniref:Uncharacterized protein n=1 Tax=Quercus lobata TaxID=97700 RepID=A0A7N2LS69_QUELO
MQPCSSKPQYSLHTTRSWEFLGLEQGETKPIKDSWRGGDLLSKARYGKDVIVGLLDTGVWPQSKSFSDEGMGPIPKSWKGICQTGIAFSSSHCNTKLISARYYLKGYKKFYDPLNRSEDYRSPRDKDGHGTHIALIIGGEKCTCSDADKLVAIDDAIADGVDVLSISIGTEYPLPYIEDSIAFGALHATKKNIVVSCSVGNSGPEPSTLYHSAPWLSRQCLPGSLSPQKAKGKIVLCMKGSGTRIGKGIEVKRAGSAGFILGNSPTIGAELVCDAHVLPATACTALLIAIRPTWSSAAIRSALMTTAGLKNNLGLPLSDESGNVATPFAYGSGHLRPTKAVDPGLSQTLVLARVCFFAARPPIGFSIKASPSVLSFDHVGQKRSFIITFKAITQMLSKPDHKHECAFGRYTWTDGQRFVRSSMAVSLA